MNSSFGDSSNWDAFFQDDLVPKIVAHVLSTWDKMVKPASHTKETDISRRLYSALVNAKDRSTHAFLIRYEDPEVDAILELELGRKDIVFYPSTEEGIYFCLEAKRLNAVTSGEKESLADKYVKEGMLRFVKRKYSKDVRHGAMAGYVLDGNISRAIKNIERNIKSNLSDLGMDPPGVLAASMVRPADPCVRETLHRRASDTRIFRLQHLFLLWPHNNDPRAEVAHPDDDIPEAATSVEEIGRPAPETPTGMRSNSKRKQRSEKTHRSRTSTGATHQRRGGRRARRS